MKILFLTTILPIKPSSGGEIVSRLFIDNLTALGHNVDVLGYLRKKEMSENRPSNMYLVKEIVIESNSSKLVTMINLMKSYIAGISYSSQKYITKEYIKSIRGHLKNNKYQLIIIDHCQMGWVLEYLPPNVTISYVAHNVECDLYEQLSKSNDINNILCYIYKREAYKIRILEQKLVLVSKYVWLLTLDNKSRYFNLFTEDENKLKVVCIPPTDIPQITSQQNNQKSWDIGIIGTWSWKANLDGLKWFIEEVYPLLPESTTISIAGIGADWLLNKYKNVSYIGFVDDANSFMKNSKVIAIPSTTGDGIQIKTIQAISLGQKIVATPFALRGISNLPSYVDCAESPIEFKNKLVSMISSIQQNHDEEAIQWGKDRQKQFLNTLISLSE